MGLVDWMNSVFGNAEPPPPLYPVPGPTPPIPASILAPPFPPSPVPGCLASTWAAYENLMALREGVRYQVYYDTRGKPTGGEGHLILPSDGLVVGNAISDATVKRWFAHDGASAMDRAVSLAREAGITSQAFLPYLASVCYQLGGGWTVKFPHTWDLICRGEYEMAANACVATLWDKQTPLRTADFEQALRALPPKEVA